MERNYVQRGLRVHLIWEELHTKKNYTWKEL